MQVRVALGDVPFPFAGKFHLTFQEWARELGHQHLSKF